uniref:Uncharacterized protein n=1 Tax=Oryza sativa subsp. japonica TaxID=39947 RepID=Q6Z1I8_ORYSJ|nr:hypothetical protein [Oryza sativa Japonica Group]BAD03584.1 hypothetical protein [Oryza sativa Japonica Group]
MAHSGLVDGRSTGDGDSRGGRCGGGDSRGGEQGRRYLGGGAARLGGNRRRELDRATMEGETIAAAAGGQHPTLCQAQAVRLVGWPAATRGRDGQRFST